MKNFIFKRPVDTIISIIFLTAIIFTSVNATMETGNEESPAIDTVSSKLFPLKIGDKRIYSYVYHTSTIQDVDTYVREITDTVTIGGKKYYKEENYYYYSGSSSVGYYRIDTSNGNLLLNSTTGCSYYGGDIILDSLAASLNDTIIHCGVIIPGNDKICTKDDSVSIFSTNVKRKSFLRISFSGFSSSSSEYVEKFGLSKFGRGQGRAGWVYELKGGIIDGTVYGDTSLTSISTLSSNIPDRYELSQNYPNPFNPSTTIEFKLRRGETVDLKVYDISGAEVDRLINNTPLNAGEYRFTFDAGHLSSGVYFYEITAGSFKSIRKMVFIK